MLVNVGGERGDGRREGSIYLFGCHLDGIVLLCVLVGVMNAPSRAVKVVAYRLLSKFRCPR